MRRPSEGAWAGGVVATAVIALTAGCGVQAPGPQPPAPAPTASGTTSARPSTPSASPTPTPTPPSPSASATPSESPAAPSESSPTSTEPAQTCPEPADKLVTQAPGKGRTVALTFDDGPGPADPEILKVLADNEVHATFFFTGLHASQHPEQVRAAAKAGHLVADHTWEHRYPRQVKGGWKRSYLNSQLTRTNTELSALTGEPVCFFRPPGGFTTNVLAVSTKLGMTAVLWSVDSEDWQQPGRTTKAATATIVANATEIGDQTHPIVLMHSSKASHEPDSKVSPYRGNTIAALPKVIAWYRDHGFRFVRLDGRD